MTPRTTDAPATAASTPRPARSEPSRRGISTCRTRCRSTAGGSCTRSGSPTRPTATLSPRRDNVILVCHALSGDAHAAGFSNEAAAQSTRDGFGADDRDGDGRQGARLVGRDDRPRQGVRHRPVLRRLHEPARRLPRDDGPVVARPGDGQAVRLGLPGDHRRGHGENRACVPGRARDRAARRGGRRLARRHAGVRVGDPVPRPGRRRRRDRQHACPPPAGRGLERDRPGGDHARPGVAGRPLLRHGGRAERRHGRGADDRPHHLPLGGRRSATSSAGGCSSPTTSATRSPSRSSRSRATCGTRPTRSSGGSTPTPTSTRRGR